MIELVAIGLGTAAVAWLSLKAVDRTWPRPAREVGPFDHLPDSEPTPMTREEVNRLLAAYNTLAAAIVGSSDAC